jgi:hypothetical protein
MLLTWYQLDVTVLCVGVVILTVTTVVQRFFSRQLYANGKLRKPPCLPWLPIIGSLPFLGKPEMLGPRFMQESKRRGNVIAFYAGSR